MMHRLPYPKQSPLAFPILLFAALAFVLAVILIASSFASAGSIPTGGPQLGGKIAPDQTAFMLWYFGSDGAGRFVQDGETFKADALHVVTFAPTADIGDDGKVELVFIWERNETIVREEIDANGNVSRRVELVWNETDRIRMNVDASSHAFENTELRLPDKHGERLTIAYLMPGKKKEGSDEPPPPREYRLAQFTHDTSPLFERFAGENREQKYLVTAKFLFIALGCNASALVFAHAIYKRAGRYVPRLHPAIWIAGALVGVSLLFAMWLYWREGLVLKGLGPMATGYFLLSTFLTLQVWPESNRQWIFFRLRSDIGSGGPAVSIWFRAIPNDGGDDERAETEDPRLFHYVETTWGAFFLRVLFGARTFLELPDDRKWCLTVDNSTRYRRAYFLNGDLVTRELPGFYLEHIEGNRLPRIRFRKFGFVEVPVSGYMAKDAVLDVISDLKTREEVGEGYTKARADRAEALAKLRAGTIEKAGALMDEYNLQMRAVRVGRAITHDVRAAHAEMKRRTEPNIATADAGHATNGKGRSAAT